MGILRKALTSCLYFFGHRVYRANEAAEEYLRSLLELFAFVVATPIAVFQCLSDVGWPLSEEALKAFDYTVCQPLITILLSATSSGRM